MPSSRKKNSLGLEISNLLDPTPSEIIPDDDWDEAKVDSDLEDDFDINSNNENRLIMRSDISLTEGRYKGKKSSREKMGLNTLSNDNISESNEDYSSDQSNEEEFYSDEEINDPYYNAMQNINDNVFKQAEELENQSNQIEKQKKEKSSITLVNNFEKEIQKAKHTKNQQRIWDELLKFRIKEQRSLILANRLPQYNILQSFNNNNNTIQSELTNISKSIQDILSSLLQIGYDLRSQHSSLQSTLPEGIYDLMNSDLSKKSRKRRRAYFTCNYEDKETDPVTFYWSLIEEYASSPSEFYKETIDYWQKKTQLVSRLSQTKFKAINQSIVSQIDSTMQNPNKLIEKTQQLKSTKLPILGKNNTNDNDSLSKTIKDPEIFDDSDFYQKLLKSLIEQDISADPTETTRAWLKSRDKKKQKKDYNSRLSKDRVISFNVHDKLVDFMTPTCEPVPGYANDLFKNLFT